jgi:hypothetical protein
MTHPDLRITFRTRPDGVVVMHCTRADGSGTWQRQHGPRAAFFPLHDLTHFAVETVLGARDGFFGLLADGWDITETDGKGARGPLPPEAVLVEHLVGILSQDRIGGSAVLTAADVQELLSPLVSRGELRRPRVTDEGLARARAERDRLQAAWGTCPVDTPFALDYHRPARSALLGD